MDEKNALPKQSVSNKIKHEYVNFNAVSEQRQPLRGLTAYERLRAEWICANPTHTEAELLAACIVFARACGLILREKVLEAHRREIERPADVE